MNILLISSGPDLYGGVETLFARMSGWLLAQGHSVTLLCRTKSATRHLLPDGLRLLEVGKSFDQMCLPSAVHKLWGALDEPEPQVIKCFELQSAWLGTLISRRLGGRPKVLYGCYAPDWKKTRANPFRQMKPRFYEWNMLRCIPSPNRLFLTPYHITNLKRRFGESQHAILWPLPVNGNRFQSISRSPQWGRLVSIGRLDPMKEYNLYMIDLVARLRAKGMNVTWRVFGDGKFREEMQRRIAAAGLEGVVTMEGILPYEHFADPLADAYLFVGMGTALVEAAFCRVPNLCAIASEHRAITYGSLADLPLGNTGESQEGHSHFLMEERIEALLRLSPEEYDAESLRQFEAAQAFGMDHQMRCFMELVDGAQPVRPPRGLEFSYTLYRRVRYLVDWFCA